MQSTHDWVRMTCQLPVPTTHPHPISKIELQVTCLQHDILCMPDRVEMDIGVTGLTGAALLGMTCLWVPGSQGESRWITTTHQCMIDGYNVYGYGSNQREDSLKIPRAGRSNFVAKMVAKFQTAKVRKTYAHNISACWKHFQKE